MNHHTQNNAEMPWLKTVWLHYSSDISFTAFLPFCFILLKTRRSGSCYLIHLLQNSNFDLLIEKILAAWQISVRKTHFRARFILCKILLYQIFKFFLCTCNSAILKNRRYHRSLSAKSHSFACKMFCFRRRSFLIVHNWKVLALCAVRCLFKNRFHRL